MRKIVICSSQWVNFKLYHEKEWLYLWLFYSSKTSLCHSHFIHNTPNVTPGTIQLLPPSPRPFSQQCSQAAETNRRQRHGLKALLSSSTQKKAAHYDWQSLRHSQECMTRNEGQKILCWIWSWKKKPIRARPWVI